MRSQSGLGILQAIAVSFVFLAVFLLLTRLMDKQIFLTDLRGRNADRDLFSENLEMQLEDPHLCTLALGGTSIETNLGENQSIPAIKLSYGSDPGPIQAGWQSKSLGTKVSSIQLVFHTQAKLPPSPPEAAPEVRKVIYDWPNLATATPNEYLKFYGKLSFRFQDDRWNPLAAGRPIELAFVVDPATKKIQQCHGLKSIAEACESLGGSYDASDRSPAEYRCNPDLLCFSWKDGLVKDSALCTAPYVAVDVGRIDDEQVYMCNWCNRNR